MTHLTLDELRAWRDGVRHGRDRIIAHLAACDQCGAQLAELVRTSPVEAAPSAFDADDFRAAGHRTGQFRAGRRRPWVYAPGLAAAAAIIAAIVYLAPSFGSRESTFRGDGAVRVLQPSGTVAREDLTFTWEGPPGTYKLRVIDLETPGEPVLARDNATSGYRPAADEMARLRPGVTYRWFVEPSDSAATSGAGRFTLR